MTPPKDWKETFLLCLGFALVAALFRLPILGQPGVEVFDEVYHATTARAYVEIFRLAAQHAHPDLIAGVHFIEWVHPPLAKELIAVGIALFGYDSWAWRLVPAFAGVALAPVFFLFARCALRSERAAILATVLLLCDGVYLVQSRIAMTNIFAVLFQVAAVYAVLGAALSPRLPVGGMLGAGVAIGLALSTRWTSLWATAFAGLVLLAVRQKRIFQLRELALTALAFAVVPAGIYTASYLPWYLQGHALSELPGYQRAIWNYHAGLQATHPYYSAWYTWPWLYRPTWYHFERLGNGPAALLSAIFAVGNPALWWASVPAVATALGLAVREREPRALFAAAGFACLWLPWGLSPRTLNFSHYLFEAIPYACLALALLLDRAWDTKHRPLAMGYVGLTVALFLFFYPVLSAYPIPYEWFYYRLPGGAFPWTWFPTWL